MLPFLKIKPKFFDWVLPFLPTRTLQTDKLLTIELGLERISTGVFINSSDLSLTGLGRSALVEDLSSSLYASLEAVSATVDSLPSKARLGLSDSFLDKQVVKIEREKPEAEINREELESILENFTEKAINEEQLYFSSLIYVIVDNNLVSNPIGVSGKSLELGILNAYYSHESLRIIQEILDEKGIEIIKIMPTPHAFALFSSLLNLTDLLVVRVGEQKTQVVLIRAETVDEVEVFDLGLESMDVWLEGLGMVLEQKKLFAENIWVYSENGFQVENLVGITETFSWKEKFGMIPKVSAPEIRPTLREDPSLSVLAQV